MVISGNSLHLLDTETGESSVLLSGNPRFVEWAPGETALLVRGEWGKTELLRVNPARSGKTGPSVKTVPLPEAPVAAHWLRAPDELLALSASSKTSPVGTFVTYRLFRAYESDEARQFHRADVYFPVMSPDLDFRSAWAHARPHPVEETALVAVYRNPPVMLN